MSEYSQTFRLPCGGIIDRSRPLRFSFDGKSYTGFEGDTLASALLANGVRLVGRSFKYHRPRGILSAGSEEPNALVELRHGARREANTRATVTELFNGLEARSQNRWPSLRFDALSVNSLLSPILAAGFYYKTFMWPAVLWEKLYEPMIRRAAGLGRATREVDPDGYEKVSAFCDVLVIGAGPTGLMAALSAARTGARVIVADEGSRPGGSLLGDRRLVGGKDASAWVKTILTELAALDTVRILPRTTVFGVYDHGAYGAVERTGDHLPVPLPYAPRQRLWRITARQGVLAAGAIERPLVFGDNDRPGVMLAQAARTYANRYAVRPGTRAVVFTNNDAGLTAAADLHAAGIAIAAIVDPRSDAQERLKAAGASIGADVFAGAVVSRARGASAVRAADVVLASGERRRVPCDLIAVSGGFDPALQLTTHLGGRPQWSPTHTAFLPGTLPPA